MPKERTGPTQPEPRQGDLIIPPTMIVSSKEELGIEVEPEAPRRVGLLGHAFLIIATLLAFNPILWTDFLWTEYDEVERTVYPSMDDWTEVWSADSIRRYDPITITTYYLESFSPLPVATTHRLINLLLHLTAALLLLKILESLKLKGARSVPVPNLSRASLGVCTNCPGQM